MSTRDAETSCAVCSTLTDILRLRAREQSDRRAYIFLDGRGEEELSLTFAALDRRARAVAVRLAAGAARRERALLLYPPSLEFIVAFLGCLYAGVVAVPAYPPRRRRGGSRLRSIVSNCRPRYVLSSSTLAARSENLVERIPELSEATWLATEDLDPTLGDGYREPRLGGEDLAFLQYTSGSTADPKGVMVTHGNLLHNQEMIRRGFGHSESTVVVGWLPLYHDMGLIGNVLHPLFLGVPAILMSPMTFFQRPVIWLRAITRYRATTSGAPSFAYELCARKISAEERQELDLGSWRVAFNGAEPVRWQTMERFVDAFAPCGFRREAFYPCYGLAEATLFVTGGAPSSPPAVLEVEAAALERNRALETVGDDVPSRALVGCGRSWSDQKVAIVDPVTMLPCPAGEVGEIWISGDSVAAGYWLQTELSAETFGARLAGEGPYLRTGDLGFLAGDELFVTGRRKDLIILRGRNHYPQDIERTAEDSHPLLRPGCGCAFSVEREAEERLVVVQEIERRRLEPAELTSIAEGVRSAVAEGHQVAVEEVLLVRRGAVAKTSSGKVRRRACRAAFLAGELALVARSSRSPRGEAPAEAASDAWPADRSELDALDPAERRAAVRRFLEGETARLLRLGGKVPEPRRPLIALGLDSLAAVELVNSIEARTGVAVSLSGVLEGADLLTLGEEIVGALEHPRERSEGAEEKEKAGDGQLDGDELSYGQQALWLDDRLAPASAVYNLAGAARIRRGEGAGGRCRFEAEALRRACQTLVARHEALRTTFVSEQGEPLRRVHDEMGVDFELRRSDESLAELEGRLSAVAYEPFDLERGPLLRVRIFSLAGGVEVLVLAVHHLVADFWSLSVLMRELGELYRQERGGSPAALEPLGLGYGEHVRRQRNLLSGPRGERLWRFWRKLGDGPARQDRRLPVLDLPSDRPRPRVRTYLGAACKLRLDVELADGLRAAGNARGATLFMTLLAGFESLLHLHTGQPELLVGSPVAGRATAGFEGTVGYFVNPLVLRLAGGDGPAFAELLQRVRRTALEAFEHQDFPFAILAERLQPERDPSRPPLFQTMFVFHQARRPVDRALAAFAMDEAGAPLALGDLRLESLELGQCRALVDLTLAGADTGAGLVFALQYNRDLFDDTTVRRLAGHFATLLAAAVGSPEAPIRHLPLLTAPERAQLLREWAGDPLPTAPTETLHGLFERQAAVSEDAVAVAWENHRLSYRELERQANRRAHHLVARGLGPERRAALLLDRTPELVVSLLAILKAGGAYVPLDPEYPAGRLEFMLEDTGVSLLLTARRFLPALPEACRGDEGGVEHGRRRSVVTVLVDDAVAAERRDHAPARGVGARHLAYVIYTSGSTGVPKGVAIEHRSAVALARWAAAAYDSTDLDGVLASTSICFDLSVFELFAPLSTGGRLVLASDALALPRLPAADEVRTINTVPSAMAELLRAGGVGPGVRVVNLAGEPLSRSLVERIYRQTTVGEVFNLYGPSEDTTYSTWSRIAPNETTPPTIGRPVAGARVLLLGPVLDIVAPGVAGEIHLGGGGLARGYLARPARTAERFIPDPFGPPSKAHPVAAAEGGRLYRTGDLARYRSNGEIEFLGRRDHQVKLRGFRIELGEVEAILVEHPEIREAVVMVRDDLAGGRGLMAYVVPEEGVRPGSTAVRDHLRQQLPDHMVPAFYAFLDALPLTPNGKIDRTALSREEPQAGDGAGARPRAATGGTPVEELLADIFSTVLGAERIGPQENFFDLGGHSLLASQVVSRIREVLGIELPLRAVFEAPTVAGMAEVVGRSMGAAQSADLLPLLPVPRECLRAEVRPAEARPAEARPAEARTPLSFAQQRLWFLHQLEPAGTVYNIPAAVRLRGPLDVAVLGAALAEIVRRHEVLRTTFDTEDGEPVQVIACLAAGWACPPVVDLRALGRQRRQAETRRRIELEARRPFALSRGPLLRVALLRVDEAEHVMLLSMHHIISDGWSMGVLMRELGVLYGAYRDGRLSPLPELEIRYADFADWQRRWLAEGGVAGSELAYWKGQLEGLPPGLELPTDRPYPAVRSSAGAIRRRTLTGELAAAVRALARRSGATRFMTHLAAFQALLSRYTGKTDIAVGAPVAGREQVQTEGLIGFFVNMLTLRSDLSRDPTFEELLNRVRETALSAYAHQSLPFEKLVEELEPERDMSRTPLFQVAFAWQHAPISPELAGLELDLLPVDNGTAKFDLTLMVAENTVSAEPGVVAETMPGLEISVEYNRDLFDGSTIDRLTGHFETLFEGIVACPRRLSQLPLLTVQERAQLQLEWNDTGTAPAAAARTLSRLAEHRAEQIPDAVAAVCEARWLTYRELNRRANRLAHGLRRWVAGSCVGICIERSPELIVALLGSQKAGLTYVPLEPAWPTERKRWILTSLEVSCLLTGSSLTREVHELLWQIPCLTDVVLLDVESIEPVPEPVDRAAVRTLFDHVAERARDRITAGGFVSSYTDLPFDAAEVDRYRDRVSALAESCLGSARRVLEIGCGSGLILFELAPRVERYVGVDPSEATQKRNRESIRTLGLSNVELVTAFADEVDSIVEGSFDLVILASTIQFFPGPIYLEEVLKTALDLLAPAGALLIADVLDSRRKDEFKRSLDEFRKRHGGRTDLHTRSRLDGLYLDEGYFHDLRFELPGVAEVEVFHRSEDFESELSYRYDVLLKKSEGTVSTARRSRAGRRNKWRRTGWHLGSFADRDPPWPAEDGIAYIIFTSGSTGNPKGVMMRHESAVNLIDWVNRTFGVGAGDRLLFVTSPCFDLSVYDVFGILAAGGSIRIAREADLADPRRLVRLLLEDSITFWDSAPAAFEQLGAFLADSNGAGRLRLAFLSGDWVGTHLPDQLRESFPAARLIALGGATEAAVWSNYFSAIEVDPRWRSIPYGRPIQNARYDVLDSRLESCPVGVVGDLYIGGVCLACGYAGAPSLTAEKFIPDPLSNEPSRRLYRSGDRARFFADGNIEFLGRIDHQVKIRGFRIELGEIEAALAEQPGVARAVAGVREDLPGGRGLVAYVLQDPRGAPLDVQMLRDELNQKIPDYMVPAHFVRLETLPLTANGKVDRAALERCALETSERPTAHAPRTPAEELLEGMFSEVLGLERVGVEANFFDLGGHSLLATQLLSRLRDAFGVELPLRRVFEAPTPAALAQVIAAGDTSSGRPALSPVPRQAEAPLSFAQERLWFLDQLEPASPVYNVPAAVRLEGRLEIAALKRAIARIVERHEALRTTFRTSSGRPVQVIAPRLEPALPRVDLDGLADSSREREALGLAEAEALRPFDLASGPLLRAILLRLDRCRHVLLLTLHHIVSDGWSTGVFLRELAAFYGAAVDGAEPRLPELTVQYADFVAWQRQWLRGELLEEHLAYWRERLRGAPSVLELPLDRPRPALQSFRGGSHRLELGLDLARALRDIGRRRGVTLFMTLLSGFAVLLRRYHGRPDLVVGTPTANRTRVELEPLIGFFANSQVLRLDLAAEAGAGELTFPELLLRVRETTLEAYAHGDVPFEKLVEVLQPERDLSHNPFYQVVFALEESVRPAPRLGDLDVTLLAAESGTAKFDLSLYMEEGRGALAGLLEYSRDLFDVTTVIRLAAHFRRLLEAVAAAEGAALSELPLLGRAECHQLLLEANDTARPRPREPFIHASIEARAADAPDKAAVSHGARTLTYGELNRRANRLAHRLRSLGVVADAPVATALERSPELIVGLLGVLKAGGAYLPLDPAYPEERLAFMLEDSRAPVLLTQSSLAGRLDSGGAVTLTLDIAGRSLESESRDNPGVALQPENLAYTIYTSGSTGRPKGAMIEHGALASYTETARESYGIAAGDRVLQFCSISFDISIEEIVPCLANGGELVLRSDAMLDSAATFLEVCRRRRLSVLSLPTAYWHEITAGLEAEGLRLPPSLHLVIIAGERALPERLAAWHRHAGDRPRLVNTYGLTESTIISTVGDLGAPQVGHGRREVPIGRTIPDTELYLLDRSLQPVPFVVAGEIFIGGGLLARGYLHRGAVTAERFVPHAFDSRCGARLYRTGDLARTLVNGELEFMGRSDHQVKVRGYRVELGEIEAALARHPALEEALVTATEDRPGQHRLVAYAVGGRPAPTTTELRAFLLDTLPEYMIPATFVILDSWPLTPNGKVDRDALPAPQALRPRLGAEYAAPRDEVEGTLAEIWQQALGIEKIGIHDNFFDLGGHSLLLIQVHDALLRRLDRQVPIVELFKHPTIDALARHLSRDRTAAAPPAVPVRLKVQERAARSRAATGRKRYLKARRTRHG